MPSAVVSDVRFKTLKVPKKTPMRDFIKEKKLEFAKGKGFYQLTKPETIQCYKEVVARRKTDGVFLSGDAVREALGIPKKDSNFSLNLKNIPDFDVFVQSTSYNRVLMPNTDFLYEVKDNCPKKRKSGDDVDAAVSSSKARKTSAPPPHFPPGGPVEIVFSFDTTGSMSSYIAEVRKEVQSIIRRLHGDIPGIRIAIFAHGDYGDASTTYVTKWVDFTTDPEQLCEFVRDASATGGQDSDECYELVLRQVRTELSWTPGTQRSLVMIGDANPHEPSYPLNTDNIDWREEVAKLYTEMGVHIYAVQAGRVNDMEFYKELASRTQGCHLKLNNLSSIIDFLMAICYRERGPDQLQAYENEVRARYAVAGGPAMNTELHQLFNTLACRDDTDKTKPSSSSSSPSPSTPARSRRATPTARRATPPARRATPSSRRATLSSRRATPFSRRAPAVTTSIESPTRFSPRIAARQRRRSHRIATRKNRTL